MSSWAPIGASDTAASRLTIGAGPEAAKDLAAGKPHATPTRWLSDPYSISIYHFDLYAQGTITAAIPLGGSMEGLLQLGAHLDSSYDSSYGDNLVRRDHDRLAVHAAMMPLRMPVNERPFVRRREEMNISSRGSHLMALGLLAASTLLGRSSRAVETPVVTDGQPTQFHCRDDATAAPPASRDSFEWSVSAAAGPVIGEHPVSQRRRLATFVRPHEHGLAAQPSETPPG